MFTNLTDQQIEAIKKEANDEIRKKYRMLGDNTVDRIHIIYVLRAYEKVMKREI